MKIGSDLNIGFFFLRLEMRLFLNQLNKCKSLYT